MSESKFKNLVYRNEIYEKIEGCNHFDCPKCKTPFCYVCRCFRSPILAYENHYHRPDCQTYFPYDVRDKY